MKLLLIVLAVALAALRIGGMTNEAYQAAAHMFVGGLVASAFTEYRFVKGLAWDSKLNVSFKIWLAGALTVVEVACAILFRVLR